MSLSLAIAINVLADLAMLGGLAYVTSRATVLTAHMSSSDLAEVKPLAAKPTRSSRQRTRSGATALATQS
jgi:hypothetical protein